MKCPKCGFENKPGKKFCTECGEKLSLKCPKCKSEVESDEKFCGECGFEIGKPIESFSVDYSKPQSYTPKYLQDKIITTRSAIEGERKIVTVLFADVANYTAISEKLDPEEVHQIMDGCFKILMDEIHKYEGTINQFTGDGVMALFGAPVAHEDHAQRACYTALSIQNAMQNYSEKIKKDTGLDFAMRIGLNSGPVIVGSIGDDLRMDYTAVGDTTNLANRMQGHAEPGSILVSATTQKIAVRFFVFNSLGAITIKGKEESQEAYKLEKASDVVTRMDASVAKGLTRFVGRQNSMTSLMEVYEKVTSGNGQVVGIVGEAGVGKSRLLLELRNRLAGEHITYLEGQCLQYGGSILYLPILDILRSLFEITDNDREYLIKRKIKETTLNYNENLEHHLSAFQDILSVQVEDQTFLELEPKEKRERIFEAIRDLLISVSQKKPLILVVEDLHWIDETSQAFLNYLIEWIANTPIMLILLYRTEYQHSWGSKTYYNRIGLDQLGPQSSAELVRAMLEGGDVAPELRDLILNRAAGNPLFMEELTHNLLENGVIQKQNDQYVLSRNIQDIQVPDTVQGIIAARMDRLEDNLKRTMQVASVIGRDFAYRILQTITGMRAELKSYLLNLQGLEFIYEKNLFPELEYIFKHALTQEVAYNSLLLKRRKEIHENIGKAIEEIYTDRLEEFYEMLVYHYSKSDNQEKVVKYLKLAGEKAFHNYANQEAYHYYLEAIQILNRMQESKENSARILEISVLISNPMLFLGFPEGSLDILKNWEKLAKELEDQNSLALFYTYISRYYSDIGNPLEGIRYIEPRFHEAKKNQDMNLLVPLSYGLLTGYFTVGEDTKVLEIAPEVIKLIEATNSMLLETGLPFNVYSYIWLYYSGSLTMTGNFDQAKIALEKGRRFAFEINDFLNLGFSEFFHGYYYFIKGDGNKIIEHFKKSIQYFETANFPFVVGMSYCMLGYGHLLVNDPDTAKFNIEKGYDIQKGTPSTRFLYGYPLLLGMVFHELGEYAKAQGYAEEALDLTKKNGERNREGQSMIFLGRTMHKNDSFLLSRAEECILEGISILEELKMRPFLSQGYFYLGELYADSGRKEEALENLNKAMSMCREMGIDYWPEKIQEVLNRLN